MGSRLECEGGGNRGGRECLGRLSTRELVLLGAARQCLRWRPLTRKKNGSAIGPDAKREKEGEKTVRAAEGEVMIAHYRDGVVGSVGRSVCLSVYCRRRPGRGHLKERSKKEWNEQTGAHSTGGSRTHSQFHTGRVFRVVGVEVGDGRTVMVEEEGVGERPSPGRGQSVGASRSPQVRGTRMSCTARCGLRRHGTTGTSTCSYRTRWAAQRSTSLLGLVQSLGVGRERVAGDRESVKTQQGS